MFTDKQFQLTIIATILSIFSVWVGLSVSDQSLLTIMTMFGLVLITGIVVYWIFIYPFWAIRKHFKLKNKGLLGGLLDDFQSTYIYLKDLIISWVMIGLGIAGIIAAIIAFLLIWGWFNYQINGEKDLCNSLYKYENINKVPAYCIKYFK